MIDRLINSNHDILSFIGYLLTIFSDKYEIKTEYYFDSLGEKWRATQFIDRIDND